MIRKRVLEIIALQGAFREIKENLKEIAALEKLLKTPELVKDSEGNTMGKINSLIAETVELMAGIEQQCKVYSYHFGIEFNLIKTKLHKICGRQKLLKKNLWQRK